MENNPSALNQYIYLPLNFWTATNFYSYIEYVDACVTVRRQTVPSGMLPILVDHRYFYSTENYVGNYTCGMARNAVAHQLWKYGRNQFGVTECLQSLDKYISNPSVVGFFIEHAVLQSISIHGLKEIGIVKSPPRIRTFEGDVPNFKDTEDPILYIPLSFSFPAIDGVIIRLGSSEGKAYMFPIQVTIAKYHKDSEQCFWNQ
jgi:hypothetical protein